MIVKFYNPLYQEVGEYNKITKIFFTTRDKRKGEIFIKKHWFEGKFIVTPIAIDKRNLKTLLKMGCKYIDVLILGVKRQSYVVRFNPGWILSNGVTINYDLVRQGRNITNFGTQVVFDLEGGVVGGNIQKTLN